MKKRKVVEDRWGIWDMKTGKLNPRLVNKDEWTIAKSLQNRYIPVRVQILYSVPESPQKFDISN